MQFSLISVRYGKERGGLTDKRSYYLNFAKTENFVHMLPDFTGEFLKNESSKTTNSRGSNNKRPSGMNSGLLG